MGELLADIRGEGYCGYQTFRDGWVFQEAVDAVRRGDGWFVVPTVMTPEALGYAIPAKLELRRTEDHDSTATFTTCRRSMSRWRKVPE